MCQNTCASAVPARLACPAARERGSSPGYVTRKQPPNRSSACAARAVRERRPSGQVALRQGRHSSDDILVF